MEIKIIAANIKRLREAKGWSQEQLAQKSGVPFTTISKIETEVIKNPSIQKMSAIAKALEVSIDELVSQSDVVKAVVFDLDGVYFEGGTEKFIESLKTKFHLSNDEVVQVYLKSDEMQRYKRGEIASEEFWDYAIGSWNIDSTREDLVGMLIDSYGSNPDTVKYVKRLKEKGIKTAICTNNFPDRFENLKKRFKLDTHFDVMVTSYELGITKPSREIFIELATQLKLNPHEIVMSDDREVNIEALRELGFQAFLYVGLEYFIDKVNNLLNNGNE